MKTVEPFEVLPPPAERSRRWPSLVVSAVLHACIITFLLLRSPEGQGAAAPPTAPDRQLIAMPEPLPALPRRPAQAPPTKATEKPPQPTPPPPPPTRETILGPDSKHPDVAVPKEAIPEHPPAEPTPDPAGGKPVPTTPAPAPQPPAPAEQPAPTATRRMATLGELLAKANPSAIQNARPQPIPADPARGSDVPIAPDAGGTFDRAPGAAGIGKYDGREWRPSFPEAEGKCVEIPDLGRNPDGSPVLATVIGRVLDTDGRTPLGGAHLQLMGTPFGTFSDQDGNYRLEFDPHLLQKCRIQYVQVAAPGYATQLLTLAIGERVRSDDVRMRRR